MDVAKRVDTMFGVPQSSRHTVRDASADIQRMAKLLREEGITTENPERKGHPFKDPLALGSQKVAEGRLEKYFTGCFEDDQDDKEAPAIEGESISIMNFLMLHNNCSHLTWYYNYESPVLPNTKTTLIVTQQQ